MSQSHRFYALTNLEILWTGYCFVLVKIPCLHAMIDFFDFRPCSRKSSLLSLHLNIVWTICEILYSIRLSIKTHLHADEVMPVRPPVP